jgi:hypothetical protein
VLAVALAFGETIDEEDVVLVVGAGVEQPVVLAAPDDALCVVLRQDDDRLDHVNFEASRASTLSSL